MLIVFELGHSTNFTRDQFTSTYLWLNLSRMILYQMSYLILIERNIHINIVMHLDVIMNPVRTLQCLRNKNRNVREFVYKCIRLSTPKSSKMHCLNIKVGKQQNKMSLSFKCSGTLHQGIKKVKHRAKQYSTLFL